MEVQQEETPQEGEKEKVDRLTKFLLGIACILLLANLIRGENLTNKVEDLTSDDGAITTLDITAEEARDAAKKASDDLTAAIEESNNSDTIQVFRDMVATIKRIEIALCDGPCPDESGG